MAIEVGAWVRLQMRDRLPQRLIIGRVVRITRDHAYDTDHWDQIYIQLSNGEPYWHYRSVFDEISSEQAAYLALGSV